MFDPTSRYNALANRAYTTREGHQIVYKERRFLPKGSTQPLLVEITVGPSDRLDLIAWRSLGQPELFWRVCDANDVMNPADATAPGRTLRVAMPQL
jgi:hypothetical protein